MHDEAYDDRLPRAGAGRAARSGARAVAWLRTAADVDLVHAARRGDARALGELLERYGTDVWRTASFICRDRELSKDVAQEATLRAIQALDSFDAARPFRPWLLKIVANVAVGELRRDRRRYEIVAERVVPLVAREAGAVRADPDDALHDAVRALDPSLRAVVALRFFGDLSPAEIARVLEVPEGTIHSRTSRALRILREQLRSASEDGGTLASATQRHDAPRRAVAG